MMNLWTVPSADRPGSRDSAVEPPGELRQKCAMPRAAKANSNASTAAAVAGEKPLDGAAPDSSYLLPTLPGQPKCEIRMMKE